MPGTVKLLAKTMRVTHLTSGLWQTAAEPMTATVVLDGVDISGQFGPITIPPTFVRRKVRLLSLEEVQLAMVDPCAGDDGANEFHVDLDMEPVVFNVHGQIIAKRIDSSGWLVHQGQLVRFSGFFPDCAFHLFGGTAEEVTAEFVIG